MPAVAVGVGIGQSHEYQDFAVGMSQTGRPPFPAVEHHFVTLNDGGGRHVRGIRRRHSRLGHAERRAYLAGQQRLQPFFLLLVRAIVIQHFHVAGIRRVAVEYLGRDQRAAHYLGKRRVLKRIQARAQPRVGQEQVPQPLVAGVVLELGHAVGYFPAIRALLDALLDFALEGLDPLGDESLELSLEFTGAFGLGQVHDLGFRFRGSGFREKLTATIKQHGRERDSGLHRHIVDCRRTETERRAPDRSRRFTVYASTALAPYAKPRGPAPLDRAYSPGSLKTRSPAIGNSFQALPARPSNPPVKRPKAGSTR